MTAKQWIRFLLHRLEVMEVSSSQKNIKEGIQGRADGSMDGSIGEWMDGSTNEMVQWMDRGMDELID